MLMSLCLITTHAQASKLVLPLCANQVQGFVQQFPIPSIALHGAFDKYLSCSSPSPPPPSAQDSPRLYSLVRQSSPPLTHHSPKNSVTTNNCFITIHTLLLKVFKMWFYNTLFLSVTAKDGVKLAAWVSPPGFALPSETRPQLASRPHSTLTPTPRIYHHPLYIYQSV